MTLAYGASACAARRPHPARAPTLTSGPEPNHPGPGRLCATMFAPHVYIARTVGNKA
jgi:hypothetical protein